MMGCLCSRTKEGRFQTRALSHAVASSDCTVCPTLMCRTHTEQSVQYSTVHSVLYILRQGAKGIVLRLSTVGVQESTVRHTCTANATAIRHKG